MLSLLVAWAESKKGYYCFRRTTLLSCSDDYNENQYDWQIAQDFTFDADDNQVVHIQIAGSDISQKFAINSEIFKTNTIFDGDGYLYLSGTIAENIALTFDSQYVTFDGDIIVSEGVKFISNKATLEVPIGKIDILSVTEDSNDATIRIMSVKKLTVSIAENSLKLNDMEIRLQLGKTFGVVVSDETKIVYEGDKDASFGKELVDIIVFNPGVNVIVDESFDNYQLDYKDEQEKAIIDYQFNGILTTKNKELPKIFQLKGAYKHRYTNNNGEYCIYDQSETICNENWNHIHIDNTETTEYKLDSNGKISLYFAITGNTKIAKFKAGAFKDAILDLSADTTSAKCEIDVSGKLPKSICSSVVSITFSQIPEAQLEFTELMLKDDCILTIQSTIPVALRAENLRVIGGSDIVLPEGIESHISSSNFEISLNLLSKISSSVANCDLHVDITEADKFYLLTLGGDKLQIKFGEKILEMTSTSYNTMTLHITNSNTVIGFNNINAMVMNPPALEFSAAGFAQVDFDDSWKDVTLAAERNVIVTTKTNLKISGPKQDFFTFPQETVFVDVLPEKLCLYNADIDRTNCLVEYTKMKYSNTLVQYTFGENGAVNMYGFADNDVQMKADVTQTLEVNGCGNSLRLTFSENPTLNYVKFNNVAVTIEGEGTFQAAEIELDGKSSFGFAETIQPSVASVYIDFNSIKGVPLQKIKPKLFIGIEDHGPYRAHCGKDTVQLHDIDGNVVETINADSVEQLTITSTNRVFMRKTFVYSIEGTEAKLIPNFIQEDRNYPVILEFDASFDVDSIVTPRKAVLELKHATIRSQYDALPMSVLEINGEHTDEFVYTGVHCLYADSDTECPIDSTKTKFTNGEKLTTLEPKKSGRIDLHIVGSTDTNMPLVSARAIKVIEQNAGKVFIKLGKDKMALLDSTNAAVYLAKDSEIEVAKLRRTSLVRTDDEPEVGVFYGDLESAASLVTAVGDEDEETKYHLDAEPIEAIIFANKFVTIKAGEISAKFPWKTIESMEVVVKATKEGKTKISFDSTDGKKIPKGLSIVAAAPAEDGERVKFVIDETFEGVESSAPITISGVVGSNYVIHGPTALPQGVFDVGGVEVKPIEPEPVESEVDTEKESETDPEKESEETKIDKEEKSSTNQEESSGDTEPGQNDGDTNPFSKDVVIGVIGIVIFFAIVCVISICCKKRRNRPRPQANLADKFVEDELDDMETPLNRDEIIIDV